MVRGKFYAVLLLLAASAQAGVISAVGTRAGLGANDLVTWGTSADDFTSVASPYDRTSTLGLNISSVLTGGFTIFEQGGVAYAANFNPGEIILATFPQDGPVTINFATAVRGLGFNIAHDTTGTPFQGSLSFYGAGNVLFGTVMVTGTSTNAGDGSAPFLGGISSAQDILSVVVSVDQQGGISAFGINQVSLLTDPAGGDVPEPSTVSLCAMALAAGAMWRRRGRAS